MRYRFLAVTRSQLPLLFVAGASTLLSLAGCGDPGNSSPHFRLNNQGEDSDRYRVGGEADADARLLKETVYIPGRQYIADALEAMFGTPDQPYVFRETGLDLRKIRLASGPVGGLPAEEQKAQLEKIVAQTTELKKELAGLDAAAKAAATKAQPHEAALKAAEAQLATAKTANDAAGVAAAEKEIAAHKPAVDEKAAADAALAVHKAEIADLELQAKAYLVPQKGLYRQHCSHCHGTTGDGAGPTALFLYPYPRDYRQGKFKFKSTEREAKPTTEDLRRILVDGIPDTAMPTVGLLPPDEIDALVEYVKYLSIRGQAELALKQKISDDEKVPDPKQGGGRSMLVAEILQPIVDSWKEADGAVISPTEGYKPETDHDAWLAAGKELFLGDRAKCASCHGVTGLGDGRKASEPLFDDWNKDKKFAENARLVAAAKEKGNAEEVRRLTNIRDSWDLPEQQQKPRNLRLNRYRFGRAPLDIYRRIYAGINGTEMPGYGKPGAPGNAEKKLTEKEYWQLVDYVMSLPYYNDHGTLPVDGAAPAKGAPAPGHADRSQPHESEISISDTPTAPSE